MKSGEIALKGLNRSTFEDIMAKNARRRLQPLGEFKIWHAQSTTYVQPLTEGVDMDEAVRRLQTVFGIVAVTKSCVVEKDFSVICPAAAEYFAEQLTAARTFKVEAKRSDKAFPMKSPEISRELGGYLLSRFHHLKVKVEQPEITITVEIREQGAYIHANQLPGAGGIPVGTGGRAMLLLSGGIDSPVAGYMMAKRGLEIAAVHFASPPYTSDRARQKVLDLAQELTPYTGRIRLFVVPFTKLQELLPGGLLHHPDAALHDAGGRANCPAGGLRRADHRRKPGTGGQPDHAGHWLHRPSLPAAGTASLHRDGQGGDCAHQPQD